MRREIEDLTVKKSQKKKKKEKGMIFKNKVKIFLHFLMS